MKKVNKIILFLTLVMAVSLSSCSNDDGGEYICVMPACNMVTLKTNPSTGVFYMQLNDSVKFLPTNYSASPYGNKELRALIYYTHEDGLQKRDDYYRIHVDHIDTILTKQMSPVVADPKTVYGNDPVEIIDYGYTMCEDGYLSLQLRTYFGNGTIHTVYLVRTGENTVRLCHNAHGDTAGRAADQLVAFRLSDIDGDVVAGNDGEKRKITVEWTSFSGEKSAEFDYKARK